MNCFGYEKTKYNIEDVVNIPYTFGEIGFAVTERSVENKDKKAGCFVDGHPGGYPKDRLLRIMGITLFGEYLPQSMQANQQQCQAFEREYIAAKSEE
jgi:hypothetical protein